MIRTLLIYPALKYQEFPEYDTNMNINSTFPDFNFVTGTLVSF
jgi:hypothetical protein